MATKKGRTKTPVSTSIYHNTTRRRILFLPEGGGAKVWLVRENHPFKEESKKDPPGKFDQKRVTGHRGSTGKRGHWGRSVRNALRGANGKATFRPMRHR